VRSYWFFRAFARILPREFRERVFEPAWADILLDEHSAGGGPASFRARFVLFLECLRLGIPQMVWQHGRLTLLARRGVVAAAVIVGLMLLMRVRYANQGY